MNLAEGVSWATPTTMTVVDTLPKGVSYLPGTSFYGGTYKANSTPDIPEQLKVAGLKSRKSR